MLGRITVFGGAGSSGSHLAALFQLTNRLRCIVDPRASELEKHIVINYKGSDSPEHIQLSSEQLRTPDRILPSNDFLTVVATKNFSLAQKLADDIIRSRTSDCKTPILVLSSGLHPWIHPKLLSSAITPATQFKTRLDAENIPIITGVINYPASRKDSSINIGVPKNRVAEVGVTIAESPNSSAIQEAFKTAGIGCTIKETAQQVAFDKIADMLPIGILAIMDETFVNAANPQLFVGKVTEALLKEYSAIAKTIGISIDLPNTGALMQAKGAFKGSMHADLARGHRTEKGIYEDLITFASQAGIATPVLKKLSDMLMLAESNPNELANLRTKIALAQSSSDFLAITTTPGILYGTSVSKVGSLVNAL